jgi:hypothetical protein
MKTPLFVGSETKMPLSVGVNRPFSYQISQARDMIAWLRTFLYLKLSNLEAICW